MPVVAEVQVNAQFVENLLPTRFRGPGIVIVITQMLFLGPWDIKNDGVTLIERRNLHEKNYLSLSDADCFCDVVWLRVFGS